jgi:hypothetical protein
MRLGILAAGALSLVLATPVLANTLNFGAPTNGTSCSLAGNAGDRSCTSTASITNGANDATASASVRGQASADQALTTDPTAIADMTVTYDIPYTITRVVTISGPAIFNANVPQQTIAFTIGLAGDVAKDNSQVAGGLGQALYTSGTASSLGGRFTSVALDGTVSQTGGGGLASSPVSDSDSPSWAATNNSSGPAAGEVSFAFQVPTDYRLWSDFNPPVVTNVGTTWTQSLTDTLRISFRVRAESRASGSVSTTGGEAIACIGQKSPLGGFVLDDARCNGAGVSITGLVTQTGTSSVPIPEPSTMLLIGAGLAGVGYVARRKLS